ncbi:MAG: hypothetical protein K1X88_14080 [Nannocystaceae bacterium]|nr:hypothetical protein [Nannocystaceae bacterium]
MQPSDLGTFQMLWDCPQCGTAKLLGLTHRHCPNCGGAQDPARRYYPSEADKVAVSDHAFVGADLLCPACNTPNAARSSCCGACGCPLQGAKEALARSGQLAGAQGFVGETVKDAQAEARARRQALVDQSQRRTPKASPLSRWLWKLGLVVAIVIVIVLVLVFWKREQSFEVTQLDWTRTIDIEVFGPVKDSAWCDALPAGAYGVQRTKEVRDHRKVPDGEQCQDRRVDNRDGTFKEVRECTPKFRDEPIYDMRCHFSIDRWSKAREVVAAGTGRTPEPQWPQVTLTQSGQCKGCEREGARRERLELELKAPDGDSERCEVDAARWNLAQIGATWRAKVGVVTSSLDCDSLQPHTGGTP